MFIYTPVKCLFNQIPVGGLFMHDLESVHDVYQKINDSSYVLAVSTNTYDQSVYDNIYEVFLDGRVNYILLMEVQNEQEQI